MNSVRIVLAITLMGFQSVLSQTNIRFGIGAGAVFNQTSNDVFQNWRDGWVIQTTAIYNVLPFVQLGANVSYSRFPYVGNHLELAAPAVFGYRMTTSGESSHMFETAVTTSIISDRSLINVALMLKAGVRFTRIGKITVKTWMEQTPQSVYDRIYSGSGELTSTPFIGLGFGLLIFPSKIIALRFGAEISDGIDSKQTFLPLIASMEFGI